jgi:hypothetical protein
MWFIFNDLGITLGNDKCFSDVEENNSVELILIIRTALFQ